MKDRGCASHIAIGLPLGILYVLCHSARKGRYNLASSVNASAWRGYESTCQVASILPVRPCHVPVYRCSPDPARPGSGSPVRQPVLDRIMPPSIVLERALIHWRGFDSYAGALLTPSCFLFQQ